MTSSSARLEKASHWPALRSTAARALAFPRRDLLVGSAPERDVTAAFIEKAADRVIHYYRMDLLSRAVTAFSPGYRTGTTILRLKAPPLVPGHRAGTKEGPLVLVGVTNRD